MSLGWKVAGGAVLLALAYYAFKPTATLTFYDSSDFTITGDPEVKAAMAGANAAGVANATNS